MPSHRAHRRSDRSSRDCCYKPLPSLLRTATLRARNSKTKSGELCLASFSCAYVNEELSYSRPRNFAQMPTKANGSTRKKHRILRSRFLIVEVAATVLELTDTGDASGLPLDVAKSRFHATMSAHLVPRERAEAIVTASALNNLSNAQAAPTSRFARDIRVRWRVPLPLHLVEIRVTPQRMLHAILNRMKCEAEQRAEERACEAVANARHVDEEVNEKRFEGRIREEEQRRRHAVNEGFADHKRRADRAGIEHRGGNADDLSEALRGIDEHQENDAQSWRAGAVQNSIHTI